jgi:hypothetical protein
MVEDLSEDEEIFRASANSSSDPDSDGSDVPFVRHMRSELAGEDPRVYAYSPGDLAVLERVEYDRWFGKR